VYENMEHTDKIEVPRTTLDTPRFQHCKRDGLHFCAMPNALATDKCNRDSLLTDTRSYHCKNTKRCNDYTHEQ
jgi:hypothetical protein